MLLVLHKYPINFSVEDNGMSNKCKFPKYTMQIPELSLCSLRKMWVPMLRPTVRPPKVSTYHFQKLCLKLYYKYHPQKCSQSLVCTTHTLNSLGVGLSSTHVANFQYSQKHTPTQRYLKNTRGSMFENGLDEISANV